MGRADEPRVRVDVLACPRCGGRLRLLATADDPDAIRAILAAVAASRGEGERGAADRRGVANVVTRQSAPERHRAPRPPRSPARGSERLHPASSVPVRDQDQMTGPLSTLYRGVGSCPRLFLGIGELSPR